LDSSDPRYSAAAAFFVLRNAKRAAARGWRQPDVEITVDNPAPAKKFVFKWEGDEANLGETVIERDGKSVSAPRYDEGHCLEGEAAAPAVLIEHKDAIAPSRLLLRRRCPYGPAPACRRRWLRICTRRRRR
jgi:hypothetical protein